MLNLFLEISFLLFIVFFQVSFLPPLFSSLPIPSVHIPILYYVALHHSSFRGFLWGLTLGVFLGIYSYNRFGFDIFASLFSIAAIVFLQYQFFTHRSFFPTFLLTGIMIIIYYGIQFLLLTLADFLHFSDTVGGPVFDYRFLMMQYVVTLGGVMLLEKFFSKRRDEIIYKG